MAWGMAALVSALACGESSEAPVDAGADAAEGVDAGVRDAAATPDAGALDAGEDGGSARVDSGPRDAGNPFGDAGALGPPTWVELDVGPPGTCAPFVACGGDVVGTWDVEGGCVEVDIDSQLARCPGAMATRYAGRVRGRVEFGGDGVARRVAQSETEIDVFWPAFCAGFFDCGMLEEALAMGFDEVSCPAEMDGSCTCTGLVATTIDDTDFYALEGNEIVSTSSGKRWAYCVDDDGLSYEDTSPSEPREPGVIALGRR